MRLSEKYRPRTWEDFVGQEELAATLGALVRRDDTAPILISGPWGTGKSSAAVVYAQALNCDAPTASGSPCLNCGPCLSFDGGERPWILAEVDAGQRGSKDVALQLCERASEGSIYAARRLVNVINEAQGLQGSAEEALLGLFEAPDMPAYVLTTTAPERVSGPLRSRCTHVRTRLLTNGELVTFGRRVCDAENIAFEPDALALVAAASGGHVRDFVMEVERLSVGGGLTLAGAAAGLSLDWPDTALRVVTALARGRYDATKVLVRDWTASPAEKARALRDAYLFVAHVCFGPARACPEATVAFRLATPAVVDEAGAALAACPGGSGVPPLSFALALAEQWGRAAPHLHDEGDLDVELTRVAHGVTPTDLLLPPVIVAPVSAPPLSQRRTTVRAAVAHAPRTAPRAAFVTKADVRGEYRAATLLPQAYGVWFNTRLVVRWADYGVTEWKDARTRAGVTERFSALTHELGLRVRDWVGDPEFRLHWLVQHEVTKAGGYESWLLLSLPVDEREAARAWVAAHLPLAHGVLVNALGVDVWRAPNVTGRAHAVHWSLVRELWRAVDPALRDVDETGRRTSLRAVLGVPVQGPRVAGVLPAGARRWSTSQTFGSRVWAAAHDERFGFVSPVALRVWRALDTGWEADEFANRRTEAEGRAAVIAEITAQFPPGQSALTDLTREQKIRAFVESLPFDPMKRPRPRPLW